jgi:hypothetical protein
MLKETLWREIESLPKAQLETVLDFVQFLQFKQQQKPQDSKMMQRIPGLDAGTTWVSDDFDEPLSDSFWIGDDANHETSA